MTRALVSVFSLLVTLAGVLALLLGLLLTTEWALQFAVARAQAFFPKGLEIASIDGRLIGPLSVQGLDFETGTFDLALKRGELEWTPSRLFTGRLTIERIAVNGLSYTQLAAPEPPEPEEPSEPFELPQQLELPLAVEIGEASLHDFAYRAAPQAEPFVIDDARISARAGDEGLIVRRLNVDAPLFDVTGAVRVAAGGPSIKKYPVEGEFNWQARPPEYPPVEGRTRLDGSLGELVIEQTIAKPYRTEARVVLFDPLEALRFDARLHIDQVDLQAIAPDLPALTINAQARGRGSPEEIEFGADTRVVEPELGTLDIQLAGGFASQTLTIEELLLSVPNQPARLQASGQVALAGKQPVLDLRAEWNDLRWPLEGKRLAASPRGTADVQGTPDDLRFGAQARVVEPQAGELAVDLDGGFAADTVTIEDLTVTIPQHQPTRLHAAGSVALGGKQPLLDMHATWEQLRWPLQGEEILVTSPRGKIDLSGTPEDIRAELAVAVGKRGQIEGQARREGETIDLALDWRDLQWPLQPNPQVTSPTGRLQVSGKLEDYAVKLTAQVDVPAQTNGRILLDGTGSLESLDLARIELRALEGNLSGSARVAWSPALEAVVDLEGEGINPGILLADWPGALDLQIRAAAAMEQEELVAQLGQLQVSGRLRDHPFDLAARGAYDAQGAVIEQFRLVSGATRIETEGRVGETLDVQWRIESDDLGSLLPEAGGQINGRGRARGPLTFPRIEATLSASALEYRDYRLESLELNADVDLDGEDRSTVSLELLNGEAAGTEIRRIALNGEGNLKDHRITLVADTSTGSAEIALNGSAEGVKTPAPVWNFRLAQARLEYPELSAWTLQSPAEGQISSERASLSQACWTSEGAVLCLNGSRAPDGVEAAFTLEGLAFDYLAPLLPPDVGLEGKLSGRGEFSRSGQGLPQADLELNTTAGRIVVKQAESSPEEKTVAGDGQGITVLAFRPGSLTLALDEAMALTFALPLQDAGGIELEARVPQGATPLAERPLDGHLGIEILDIGFIAKLAPEVERIEGRITGDLQLAGTLAAPDIRGKLVVAEGAVNLASTGLRLRQLYVEVNGQGADQGLQLAARAQSGGGSLKVDGNIKFIDGLNALINVEGEEFQVMNTLEARIFASPDLEIRLHENRIRVTGEVRVPRAEITPQQIPPSGGVPVSDDQVIVRPGDKEKQETVAGREIYAEVRIILGNEVSVVGFGLSSRIEGNVLVIEEPEEPTTATGELQIVEGHYQAYGQDLEIETGEILFGGGPITDPGLNLRAVRNPAPDVTVGVAVRGSLEQPEVTLFSEPSMTQSEQLSWLVLGRSLDESSGGESSMLSRAALALGLKGGNYLSERFGGSLGVDTISFESDSNSSGGDQAALVIGKYLSPRLYVSYGLGLLEPVNTLRMQYTLSNNWRLETESSGSSSGGDVVFTIERGE